MANRYLAGVAKKLLCAWGRCRRLIAPGGISDRLGANVGDFAAKRVPLKRVARAWPPGHPRSFSEGFRGVPGGSGGFRSGLGIMVIGRGQENVCFGAWGRGGPPHVLSIIKIKRRGNTTAVRSCNVTAT